MKTREQLNTDLLLFQSFQLQTLIAISMTGCNTSEIIAISPKIDEMSETLQRYKDQSIALDQTENN